MAGHVRGVSASPGLASLLMTVTVTGVDVGDRWQDAFEVCHPSPGLTCLLMTVTVTGVDVGNRWQDAFEVCQPHVDSPGY